MSENETETMTPEEFRAAIQQGRRHFRGVTVCGDLDLRYMEVNDLLDFRDVTVNGSINFYRTVVGRGLLDFSGMTVVGGLIHCGDFALAIKCHMAFPTTPVHFDNRSLEQLLEKLAY